MIKSLSWIHHEREIITRNHLWLFVSPDLLDLPPDPVTLYGRAIMTHRNDDDTIILELVLGNYQPQTSAGIFLPGLEDPVDLRLFLDDFLLSKASSHHWP